MNGKQAVRDRIWVFFPVESVLFTMCPGGEYCASMRIILEIFIRRSVPLMHKAVALQEQVAVSGKNDLAPDLQNILRQSYDYLTIIPKLRSTYGRRLIYKTAYN